MQNYKISPELKMHKRQSFANKLVITEKDEWEDCFCCLLLIHLNPPWLRRSRPARRQAACTCPWRRCRSCRCRSRPSACCRTRCCCWSANSASRSDSSAPRFPGSASRCLCNTAKSRHLESPRMFQIGKLQLKLVKIKNRRRQKLSNRSGMWLKSSVFHHVLQIVSKHFRS